MDHLPILIFTANCISTWYLVGLIWIVQLVHYPLFANVSADVFPEYQLLHERRITIAVGPAMLVEALTTVLLLFYLPSIPVAWAVVGVLLVLVIWMSTAVLQVPCHRRLEQGFEAGVHQRLVRTNWIRTIAWTARGAILAVLSYQLLIQD